MRRVTKVSVYYRLWIARIEEGGGGGGGGGGLGTRIAHAQFSCKIVSFGFEDHGLRRYENDVLLNSCAANIAIHLAIIDVQENNNMTRGISTIPFQFFGWNDKTSADGNMRTP
jgi:hypothetical protein